MRILIVGAGRAGFDIAKILSGEDQDVILIDKDPEALRAAAEHLDVMTVVGNGASARTLEEVDIKAVDIILAVTENDELNMIACMTAKQYGVPMTVARVRNSDYTSPHPHLLSFSQYGIDLIINPEHLAAQEIFRLLAVPMATDMEYFHEGKLSLVGLKVGEKLEIAGQRISDLNLEKLTVVAILRDGQALIPGGNTRLLPEDRIFVLGETKGFHNLNELIKKKTPHFRRIVIAGGGLITQYLLRLLREKKNNLEVKIIDPRVELCRTLAGELEGCSIICADPTKKEVLEEEDLGPDDIFLSLQGEENLDLIASLLAHKAGVEEIICGIGREDYIPLAEMIGVTATITPRLLLTNTMLKLVRKSNIVSINLLQSGDAEIIEVIPTEHSPATQKCLRELNLPPGIVIGSILHQGRIIVPRGDTLIQPHDRVIIFALKSAIPTIEWLFNNK
ncbi:MAG: Trk system potassium transporter TrkA [Firmicutes bacterium]|nr:Trk system potassium transporter TrkA [Bacillota bacterium]